MMTLSSSSISHILGRKHHRDGAHVPIRDREIGLVLRCFKAMLERQSIEPTVPQTQTGKDTLQTLADLLLRHAEDGEIGRMVDGAASEIECQIDEAILTPMWDAEETLFQSIDDEVLPLLTDMLRRWPDLPRAGRFA